MYLMASSYFWPCTASSASFASLENCSLRCSRWGVLPSVSLSDEAETASSTHSATQSRRGHGEMLRLVCIMCICPYRRLNRVDNTSHEPASVSCWSCTGDDPRARGPPRAGARTHAHAARPRRRGPRRGLSAARRARLSFKLEKRSSCIIF